MKTIKLNGYLSQPYPYYYHQSGLPALALAIVLLCFGFNYFFEPFEVYVPEHKLPFLWICLAHGILPALIGYAYFSAINYFVVKEESWNIGKEVRHLSIVLLLIGTGNFLIRDLIYDNPGNWTFRYFWEEIRNAFLVGTLFTAILVPINFNRLLRKHQLLAYNANASKKPATLAENAKKQIEIRTHLKGDDFILELSNFLYAKATGNYVEIFLKDEGSITKLLKRISVKDLEKQLSSFPWITKTHRAYLVNTRMIDQVTGNAQGYLLTFKNLEGTIPVSRGMVPNFNQLLKKKA